MKRYLFFLIVILLSSGCSRHVFDIKTLPNKSPEDLFKLGSRYATEKPSDAVLAFEEIEKSHPYSDYVADAQVEIGKCYFKLRRYEESVSILETFIVMNPDHARVPEVLYLLGDIYFAQLPIVKRDQENGVRSLEYFYELCNRYPSSKFAKDAKARIKVLRQHLAHHEFRVGFYYQRKTGNFPAAISRYNSIIETYPETETAQETYLRLIECYLSMGLRDEALAVNKVLQLKFKNTKWAKYATEALRK